GRTASAEPQETDRTNIMPFPRLAARGSNFVDDEGGTDTRSPLSPEVAARDILSLQVEEARQRMNLRDSGEKRATETTTIGSSGTATSEFTGLEADDLRAILDVSTDGVIIVSHEGIVRDINRSAEALFDVDADAIANRSITRLLAPESHRAALDYLANMGATGVASLLNDGREVVGKTSKGGLVPLFMTVGQLQHSDDCCAVVRDITHWKKAEEELLTTKAAAEGANELKTQFLAKISHEIRTPLNAIIGFSEMMIEERLGRIDNDRYRGYLRDINRSGNHVLDLVNDLLDITKIEAGKMEMDFDAVDLNRTVSENVAILQGDANAERIIIRTSLSTVVPKVVADQRSMRQIVLNLVSNSIKFTKSGGQVIVSTVYEDTGEVVLRVRDTGVGMTADEIEQALQPFRQTASSSVSESKGTGLGLPLTKALVEANRADFHIESTPDEGTLVEIHFPVQRVLADR
ncbi:MAG: HAMP domain-containing sensor histidine kinase, partial [Pseudomonadota bacterium]